MRNKLFFHISRTHEESNETMKKYYASLGPEERLDIAQYLREQFYKVKGRKPVPMDKKLFRVIIKEK